MNLYAPISYIYGGNVFIYVRENTQLRHQVILLNIMEYNAVRLSGTLYGFQIFILLYINFFSFNITPAESTYRGMIYTSDLFLYLFNTFKRHLFTINDSNIDQLY